MNGFQVASVASYKTFLNPHKASTSCILINMHTLSVDPINDNMSTTTTFTATRAPDSKGSASLPNGVNTEHHAPLRSNEWQGSLTETDRAVLALRNLIFDVCNQNGGGHGGSAIGMSAIGVALYKYVMRYNPADSEWFDRDRFVLSNGEYLGILQVHSSIIDSPYTNTIC